MASQRKHRGSCVNRAARGGTGVRHIGVCALALTTVAIAGCPGLFPPPDTTVEPTRARLTQKSIDDGDLSISELIYAGRNLAIRNWGLADGFGNALNDRSAPNINRLTLVDSTSCQSCHGAGNGLLLGWGNNAANVLVNLDNPNNPTIDGSNERSTPAVHGLVLLELLAKEISLALQGIRDAAIAEAQSSGQAVTRMLTAKGINYGQITANPNGSVDTSGVEGIDRDLRVRPFHAKGHEATIRIFTRGALNRHHGIQSTELLRIMDASRNAETWDQDEDGVVFELSEGELTAMTVFQVCLPVPQEVDQDRARVMRGRDLMDTIGCTECHISALRLSDPTWSYTSSRGVTTSIDLLDVELLGAGRLVAEADGSVMVPLWGDLKRHDLGEEAHEPLDQPVDLSKPNYEDGAVAELIDESLPAIAKEMMMTTELWGGRDTGPWWHDGSSPTIEDAILRHGGDSQASRDAYAALTDDEKSDVLAFLNSLVVAPVGEVLFTSDPAANQKPRE